MMFRRHQRFQIANQNKIMMNRPCTASKFARLFTWRSHGVPTVLPLWPHGGPTVWRRQSHGPRSSHGGPTVIPRFDDGCPAAHDGPEVVPRWSHGGPTVVLLFQTGPSETLEGRLLQCQRDAHGEHKGARGKSEGAKGARWYHDGPTMVPRWSISGN